MRIQELVILLSESVDCQPEFTDGGARIFHMQEIAPRAYLHTVFPPLNEELTTKAFARYGQYTNSYVRYLANFNGALLFGGKISLRGYTRYTKELGAPISLDYGNIIEVPHFLDAGEFVFGALVGETIVPVLTWRLNGLVRLRHTTTGEVGAEWDSLDSMLVDEIGRLSRLHDNEGLFKGGHRLPEGARHWDIVSPPDIVRLLSDEDKN